MASGKSPEEVQKLHQQLIEWVSNDPQLPNDLGDKLLLRFLHSCYYDLEKAKNAVQRFCSIRFSVPELLNNRDPLSEASKKAMEIVNLAQIDISGNRTLWIWQLNDPGLDRYDYAKDARIFFLSTDYWMLTDDKLEDEDVVIMDVKDISLKFITKFNVFIARKLSKYQEDALPIRLKQIHLVNAPPFIDKINALMKPFMKQEYIDMIHVHPPKSDTLFQYFDKSELPSDYGGTRESMDESMKKLIQGFEQQREHFLKDDLWKAKKSKSNKPDSTEVGSFRSLAID